MKKSNLVLIVVGAVVVAVVAIALLMLVWGVSTYNSLIGMKEEVNSSLSTIDVQLKRRNDLIPNLVSTVKGFAAHETAAINSVTEARAKLNGATTTEQTAQADGELTSALSRLLVIVENYPTLKADANFRQLSDELAGTENRISVARQDYNNVARSYNSRIRKFPTNLIASKMNLEQTPYFQAAEGEKEVPKVTF